MRFELFSKLIINGFLNVLSVKDRAWDRANLLIPDNEMTVFFRNPVWIKSTKSIFLDYVRKSQQ